ncbi:MAG: family 78 glycoside hydrolase catalytic domain, partial [Mangrovibacterium sp.]|nr:family 78 glycoside hydrolase catalytic domain [Mangrovibacterium sp.]
MKRQFVPLGKLCRSFLLSILILLPAALAAENNYPSGLTVNFLAHAGQVFLNGYPVNTPIGEAVARRENFQFAAIAQKRPFFGWMVGSSQPHTLQAAYRILVASSLENITTNKGDWWDSGKTESAESVNVVYEGKALEPGQVYFWKVKTWDNHGVESDFSPVSRFKMASKLADYATARYPLQKQDEYPVTVRPLPGGVTFADFGKDAFGRLRLNLYSKTGKDTVVIRLGEALKNGRIDPAPGGTIRYSRYELALRGGWNTYVVALDPDKRNTGPRAIKMPVYTGEVTPFRYCEIEGYDQVAKPFQVVRETVFYPFDETESFFTSSDTVLNQVWDLCKYSMKATS